MALPQVLATRTLSSWNSGNFLLRLAKRIVPRGFRSAVKGVLERVLLPHLPVRRHLERKIIPAVTALHLGPALVVGVAHYTAGYHRQLGDGTWTIDVDPAQEPYGAPSRHLTASVAEVDRHFEQGYFGVAILNGVLGWGLNSEEDQNHAFRSLRRVIRPGGLLIVGWEDFLTRDPLRLPAVRTGFRHSELAGLPARQKFADFNQREHPGASYFYDIFTAF
jgi:hypothetical protein